MTANGTLAPRMHGGRVDWVDYAKGICIIMVVMMHSVLGVEAAAGQTSFMHYVVEFARPFRMPDFFLISGLFLAVVIDRGWRTYLDRKVVHFAYFYVLWVTIQFAFKAPSFAAEMGWIGVAKLYALSFIDPFGTLWFIYLLPIFFIVTKLTRRLPPLLIWAVAALLESLHVATGWMVPDEFCARFFYFYTGYLFARHVFAFSDAARARPVLALLGFTGWAVINAVLVHIGAADLPVISLLLGLAGACAIITVGTLLAEKRWLDGLRFCGEHSIVIYLAFFLPMAISRSLLLKYAPFLDLGVIAIIVNIAGVVGALIIWKLAMKSGATFLFERPDAFWIAPRKQATRLQAAE
ncbi:acyltransferase family protein [Rhodopseudomonas palustris]|uniref:acyltransferase family protein n=1 Tax=Rhodopseudomonas palustris TaxID=1076 RepID=UPI0021F2939D|nr:acyltransferase family protein [Rhodopseudomonas palustris]UYO44975.1 acyltransferase family protein [Rhodopseudomonas palustris]